MIFTNHTCWSQQIKLRWLLALSVLIPTPSLAEKDKERLDQKIVGHYVRLVADEREDSILGMKFLRSLHQSCTEGKRAAGKHYLPEPSGGWPKTRSKLRAEYYYTRTRVLVVHETKSQAVRLSNCDLYERTYKKITLTSAAGTCMADLARKYSFGQCDATVHRRMIASPLKSKLGTGSFKKTGTREISGYTCTVYFGTLLKDEICIANPPSDFPIPDQYSEGVLPGLKLQIVGKIYNAKAESVLLHTEFNEDIFSIPEGLLHISVPDYENRYKLADEERE